MLTEIDRLYEPMLASLPKTVVSISKTLSDPDMLVRMNGLPSLSVTGSASV